MPIYMKYEGINGTGTGKYKDWIVLQSCLIGEPRRVGSVVGGSNAPMPVAANLDITAVKKLDGASTQLFQESLNGKYRNGVIDFVKDGEKDPYLSYQIENALISSYSVSGDGSGENWETIIISFGKLSYSLKPLKLSHEPTHVKEKARWGMAIK